MEKNSKILEEEDVEEYNHRYQQVIWSWGAGTDGQLATGKLQDEHSPQLIRSLSAFGPISFLSCGGAHVIALTPGGRVLTWGRGSSGQLGHGEVIESSCLVPKEVKSLEGFVISQVSAGWNHSGFVSGDGDVFTCGDGSFGQLGHGDQESHSAPVQISYFNDCHVEQVACGMRHTLVLLRDAAEQQVYGFGAGRRGQLGISTEKVKSINLPHPTIGLLNAKIISITANGDHSAALSSDGSPYTWGRGFDCASDECTPRLLNTNFSFDQVAPGWNHALLLGKGEVFMIGGDRHGVLGESHKTTVKSGTFGRVINDIIQRIPDLVGKTVMQIAAGSEHSALVTENGSVLTWGWGEHGQLGLGDTTDRTTPSELSLTNKLAGKNTISTVYCGSGFTFVLRTLVVDSEICQ